MISGPSPQPARLDAIQPGATAETELVVEARHVDAFAAFSGDDNALHVDDGFAQRAGFRGRVAHGMIALSLISRLIGTQLPGHGSLWMSQDLQFAQPVHVGDRLRARVYVDRVSAAAQVVMLTTEVTNADTGAVVLRGAAKVRVPTVREA